MTTATAPATAPRTMSQTITQVKALDLFTQADAQEQNKILQAGSLIFIHEALKAIEGSALTFEGWARDVEADWELLRIIKKICSIQAGALRASVNRGKYGTIQPLANNQYVPGAVIVDSWGCEQTNVDYYCIVARSGDTLTMLPVLKHSDHDAMSMTATNTPGAIDFSAEPIRKKVKRDREGVECGFSFRAYAGGGWAKLWNGKKTTSTHYA